MKKDYIKPEMLVEEILIETMIATSEIVVDPYKPVTPTSNNRGDRTWGDLWD